MRPSRKGGWRIDSLSTSRVSSAVSDMMVEKIIVVDPTTAVPMSKSFGKVESFHPGRGWNYARRLEKLQEESARNEKLAMLGRVVGGVCASKLKRFHWPEGPRQVVAGGQTSAA